MKEFNDIAAWLGSLNNAESPFPALSEWMELESRRAIKRSWIGVGGAFGILGGLLVSLGGVELIAYSLYSWSNGIDSQFLFLLGAAIGVAPLLFGATLIRRWLDRRRTQAIDPEVARAVSSLLTLRNYRRLTKKIGKNGAVELNEGAVLYFRCRMALMSDAWNSQASPEPWGEARIAMLLSMEAAMGRLALCVAKKRSFTEIGPILEEMRAASNEAVRVTELRSLTAGSAGQGLRASTHRMRELAKTEEEALAELRIVL